MSVQKENALGSDFDTLVEREKERITQDVANAAAIRKEREVAVKEQFRVALAKTIAALNREQANRPESLCVTYPLSFDATEFIPELVARGHYVTNWVCCGEYRADKPPPRNSLEVFRIGAYSPGSQERTIFLPGACALL